MSNSFDVTPKELNAILKGIDKISNDEWLILALEGTDWICRMAKRKLDEKQKKSLLVELKRRLEILS